MNHSGSKRTRGFAVKRYCYTGLLGLWCLCPWPALAELDLTINGVDDRLADNIEMHLDKWESLPGDNIATIRDELNDPIQNALRALGYYEAQVNYALDADTLVLTIEPGEPVVWGQADIRIQHNQAHIDGQLQTLIDSHPFAEGEVINQGNYESYKKRLLIRTANLGYLDAQFTQTRLLIDLEDHRARVVLHMNAGERYRITGVSFSDTQLRETMLERVADVPVDDWYSANTVGAVYNRLLNSGYFSDVNVQVDKQPPDAVQLDITVTDQPDHQISTGVGFATDEDGPRFRLKWERALINSRGDSMNAQLQVSQVEQAISGQYKIPWDHPQNEYISLDGGWQHTDTDERETTVATTGVAYHRVLEGGWQYSLRVDVENERSQLGDQPEETFTYVIPGANLSRRRFQGEAVDPSRGYKYWINFATSREFLGSDTDFRRLNVGFNTVYTVAERHSLLTRLEVGGIETDAFYHVPPSQRFFTGGDRTVRGYAFEDISPRDPEDNLTGGQFLNAFSLEYRYQWAKQWKAAVFADTGRSYLDDIDDFSPDVTGTDAELRQLINESQEFKTGVGVGIRWKTPIGLVSLDLASPLDDDDSNFRLHLYLGTSL